MSVTGRPLNKGSLAVIEGGSVTMVYDFQFNPTERSNSLAANYNFASPPGSALPIASFKSITGSTFGLTLLLDATENYNSDLQGVRADKAFFEMLVQPAYSDYIDDLGTFTAPPEVRYTMGGESFRILVTRCTFRDVRFNRDGFETRAFIELEFNLYMSDPALLKARLERLNTLRNKVVVRSGWGMDLV
jgi:hypothetical protein